MTLPVTALRRLAFLTNELIHGRLYQDNALSELEARMVKRTSDGHAERIWGIARTLYVYVDRNSMNKACVSQQEDSTGSKKREQPNEV